LEHFPEAEHDKKKVGIFVKSKSSLLCSKYKISLNS